MRSDILISRSSARWPRVLWAALLSLGMAGLGQVYAGSWLRGLTVLAAGYLLGCGLWGLTWVVAPSPWAMAGAAVLMGLILLLLIGAAIDAALVMRGHPVVPRKPWYRSAWFTWLVVMVLGLPLTVWPGMGWKPYSIPSSAEAPALMPGDTIVVDRRSPLAGMTRGDMVVFKLPRDRSTEYVKRVIGLPGDRIQLSGGRLYVNRQLVAWLPAGDFAMDDGGYKLTFKRFIEALPNGRSYAVLKATNQGEANNTPEYLVPADRLFVLGDNRDNSMDSRFMNIVGFVPLANLSGIARVVLWGADRERAFSRVE